MQAPAYTYAMADERYVDPQTLAQIDPGTRAAILVEALPYIQAFSGKTVVMKFGGNAMVDDALAHSFAADVVLLRAVGFKARRRARRGAPDRRSARKLGKETEFRDGLRVTDAETLDVARMVLTGRVNADIVSAINQRDRVAVGLSGEDAGLIIAEQRDAASASSATWST
jgi:acetylglutamate kinase